MKYGIMLGSNLFIGTNGVFNVEINGKMKEFFKIREIFSIRSTGSYLAVDCDIKDSNNHREIKLAKSIPVVTDTDIDIKKNNKSIGAYRSDGSLVIKVEQLEPSDLTLPTTGPVSGLLKSHNLDAILRITGDFYAGDFRVFADNSIMRVGSITLGGNLLQGTGGLRLSQMGFSM